MPKMWTLSEARKQFSRLIRDAQIEPQIILRHGQPVVRVTAFSFDPPPSSMSALDALSGDFTAFPVEDWLEQDRRTEVCDLNWGNGGSGSL